MPSNTTVFLRPRWLERPRAPKPQTAPGPKPSASRARAARRSLGWAGGVFVAVSVAAGVTVDVVRTDLRDPEYGLRLNALRDRLAENPGRPLALVVGSSRAAMAVSPEAWEAARPGTQSDPLLFNLSRVGAGPLLQLMTLRRAYADGVRPSLVVLEYWPPFLRGDGPFAEANRVLPHRLFRGDIPFVREYLPDAAGVERRMWRNRLNPVFQHRARWMTAISPSWIRPETRVEVGWRKLDEWGWLPGPDEDPPAPAERSDRLNRCAGNYRVAFDGFAVHPPADRALRESVALARANGAGVVLAYFPESPEVRAWYPPGVERAAADHRATFDVPFIDARNWGPDHQLADGLHFTRAGAAAFTRRFAAEVARRP